MKKLFLIILTGFAAGCTAETSVLNDYIRTALEQNMALQQKNISLEKAHAALCQARGMYLPQLSLQARYSRADGGRQIDIPIGDLMNPVYASLNQLLELPVFPTDLANESIPFLRREEHETKLRIVQPVFQPGIYYNAKIKNQLEVISGHERQLYARELIAAVKTSYYDILKIDQALLLLNESQALLQENLRVSKALEQAQKTTMADVYRAEAELAKLEQRLAESRKQSEIARMYFNFLLNRPLDTPVICNDSDTLPGIPSLEDITAHAMAHREELKQLRQAVDIAAYHIDLNRSSLLPTMTLVADYGFQGKDYSFTQKDDYWMASLIASWNIFNGFQDKNKIQQAKLAKHKSQLKVRELATRIKMDVCEKYKAMEVAELSIKAAGLAQKSADRAFEIVQKQYQQGMIAHIEYLDAQNRKTEAGLNTIIKLYDYRNKTAELEKSACLFPVGSFLNLIDR